MAEVTKKSFETAQKARSDKFASYLTDIDNKRIVLVGETCSGKTFLKNILASRGFAPDVSWTTREPRDGEVNGEDYCFVDHELFMIYIEQKKMLQFNSVNGHFYGTTLTDWERKNIFIMSPNGVDTLSEDQRKKAMVVYLSTPENIRLERLKERGWNEEKIAKRIASDNDEFSGFTNYDIKLTFA